ncbi:MAG: aminotransferase class V-fold PLP-dependent enzyme, partial [Candidatus Woesearchaeota archaeon]|nr:aminotransferase class V-fold PLP-dependent enzyme [Candidatus Woesearchaeota archaeon]
MNLEQFWNRKIKPRFEEQILNAQVTLLNGKKVKYVNLDNAATTKPFKAVVEMISKNLVEYGSVHRGAGQHSKISTDKYEKSREAIGKFVGTSEKDYVIFTKNTTEAINQAAALWKTFPGKILVSDIEHSSSMLPWLKHQEIYQFKTKNSKFDLEDIERILRNYPGNIKLVVITGASNVTGYKPPIHKIAGLAHKYRAKILVDVCQFLQHEKIDMLPDDHPEHIDFIAFSGHKMYAPFGAGVLVGPKSFFDRAIPYQIGGGNLPYITSENEVKRFNTVQTHDPGTPNAVGVWAMEAAIKELEEIGMENIKKYEHALVGLALAQLRRLPNIKIYLPNGHGSIIPFDIEGLPDKLVAEILALEYGIGTRAGSFCTYELMRSLKNISI